jgi:hypothetical protein
MQTTTAVDQPEQQQGNLDDEIYSAFLDRVRARFLLNVGTGPLFTTNVEGLWDIYLDTFLAGNRQYHNCNSCRHFIERFGGLVTIGDNGIAHPAIWNVDDADILHADAFAKMEHAVRRATVNGVFFSPLPEWGSDVTGIWRHLHVVPPKELVFDSRTQSADQAMAEKREDFKNVQRALEEFSPPMLAQALSLLNADALYRSEKVLGPARWLMNLHAMIDAHKGRRTNLVWRAVATAPVGFCHPRSSMIGTLLEDLAQGLPFETVARRFKDKMDPLQYQRPQAPPTMGNIEQAEKIIAKLGIEKSLERRYARVEEIEALWRPVVDPAQQRGGVFGHLKPKDSKTPAPMTISGPSMTFEKFRRTLMTSAKSMDMYVPNVGSFSALLTAVHPDAPPILQWDREEQRNPFSWYLYPGGSPASNWGLPAYDWVSVTAIALWPQRWFGGTYANQKDGAIFVLQGAKDGRAALSGTGLFPEILRSELHSIRATIEAYSRAAKPEGIAEASACGLSIQADHLQVRLRVTDFVGTRVNLHLDRWD